ncbi:MAG TPA: hypothetical protein VLA12_15220 [Planctomycetaceae bacterium]|nr:hypothetical protein [Planctomycetaceae bacterium]
MKTNEHPLRTIEIHGHVHASAHDALVELNFSGDRAISVASRFFTVSNAEFDRLEAAGIQPTTWHHDEATGRILCVPGKD